MPVPVATSRTCLGDWTGARPSLPLRRSLHIWCWRSVRFSWVCGGCWWEGGGDAPRRFCSGWPRVLACCFVSWSWGPWVGVRCRLVGSMLLFDVSTWGCGGEAVVWTHCGRVYVWCHFGWDSRSRLSFLFHFCHCECLCRGSWVYICLGKLTCCVVPLRGWHQHLLSCM